MPDITIDLDAQINTLRKRWDELKELWPDPPGPTPDEQTDQRDRIVFWMTRINEKKLALGRIRANNRAAQVTVRGLSNEEREQAEEALDNLSQVIQRAQIFTEILLTVTTILDSADMVISTAGRA